MLTRRLLFCACALLGVSATAHATPIAVNFDFAAVPPGPPPEISLPYLMNASNDAIFLKFKIPQIADVLSINSFIVNIAFYDDGDPADEHGHIEFAQPGPNNIFLAEFLTLNNKTIANPLTLTASLTSQQIATVFPSIQDGNFRIRVERNNNGGDFIVAGGTATIDANLVPEPATMLLMATGLGAIAARRRGRRRSRTTEGSVR